MGGPGFRGFGGMGIYEGVVRVFHVVFNRPLGPYPSVSKDHRRRALPHLQYFRFLTSDSLRGAPVDAPCTGARPWPRREAVASEKRQKDGSS